MNKRQLSPFQLFSLCAAASMLGVFVFSGSGISPEYFLVVISLFLLQAAALLSLGYSFSRTGQRDAQGLTGALLSYPVSRLLLAALGVLLILRSSITLSAQTDCIALYLLEDTPGFAVMLVLLLTAFIALIPGLRRLSGVSTLLVLLLPIMLVLIVGVGLLAADFRQLRVLYQPDIETLTDSFIPAALTASGAECAVFFLGSAPVSRKKTLCSAAAPGACAAVFALLFCTAIGTIGPGGISASDFPLLEASRQINMGGIELTERFDLPLIAVSLFASIAQMSIYTLCSALSLCAAFNSSAIGRVSILLLPVQFAAAIVLQYTELDGIIQAICAAGLISFSVILFPLLAMLAYIREGRMGNQ